MGFEDLALVSTERWQLFRWYGTGWTAVQNAWDNLPDAAEALRKAREDHPGSQYNLFHIVTTYTPEQM